MSAESKPKIYSRALGRRRRAVAQVRLIPGSGKIIVNGKTPQVYFGAHQDISRLYKPFQLLSLEKYDVSILVKGGGKNGQLDAVVLGIARSVSLLKKDHQKVMRDAGFLTRDSRKRQRRMIGTGGKARRKKQSPKR